LRFWLCYWNW